MFRALLQRLSDPLPSRCEVCHAWPTDVVCESCVHRFAQPSQRCLSCAALTPPGQPQCGACLKSPPPLDRCLAAVSYGFPWSGLMIDFKFQSRPGFAALFAQLLRSTPWVEPALERADLLIPMPLAKQRLQQRGFNQALVLARQLAANKTATQLLLRIRDTPAQSQLKRSERSRNVADAFAVDPLARGQLENKRVVLVDDVMTSGASLFSAAKTLRQAGVTHITALVVARTDFGPP